MTTRDVLRCNFAVRDMLLIASIALAGCAMGVLDFAADHIERWVETSVSPAEKSREES